MNDAERIMQGLAQIAVAYPGCDAVVSEAIALIERLRPKSMTTERAVELMNQIAYDGVDDWEEDEDGLGYVRSRSLKQGVGTWTAAAIGRQIEHEKEAANG